MQGVGAVGGFKGWMQEVDAGVGCRRRMQGVDAGGWMQRVDAGGGCRKWMQVVDAGCGCRGYSGSPQAGCELGGPSAPNRPRSGRGHFSAKRPRAGGAPQAAEIVVMHVHPAGPALRQAWLAARAKVQHLFKARNRH